jgi:hypothetical protein
MDIQSEVESHKFLMIFGPPLRSLCKFMTLKTGVILIAALDIFIGIIQLIFAVVFIVKISSDSDIELNQYFNSLSTILDLIAIPFALLGLKGINKVSQSEISIYSRFKIIEFGLILFMKFIAMVTNNDYDLPSFILLYVIYVIYRLMPLYLVKVVWSADIRLKYNETILVMHGEEALKLMQQQAINLADSSSYSSGAQAYISPSYSP